MTGETILVLNAGSSSLKFELFELGPERSLVRVFDGQFSGIGTQPHLAARDAGKAKLADEALPAAEVPDVAAAQERLRLWLAARMTAAPIAVGHRVVHGGPDLAAPVLVDDALIAKLDALAPLAPLHQPANLAPIRAIRARSPGLPQVACFDTAFHRGHPEVADRMAIPDELHQAGVRRYGFHGLSYELIAGRLREVAPDVAAGRVVVAHLGSGCSMCALLNGRSIDSTMGFTALDGLPMGTRPGQLDAGVVLWLMQERGMGGAAIERLLYHECGLKGLSGISNDMRDLLASPDPRAVLAVDYFVYRCAIAAAGLAAALEGLDALVFTAGVGENSPAIRARIARRLAWLGVELDEAANERALTVVSTPASRVKVMVVPTDEERMIARHTLDLVRPA